MTNVNQNKSLNSKFWQREIARQFVKFCLIGLLNTVIDFLVYLFFTRLIGLYFLYANIIAVLAAMTFSFFLNKYWTFNNRDKKISLQYFKFAIVNLIYFFLNNSIVFILVNNFKVGDLYAKVIAVILGLFWNFFANRYWTFRMVKPLVKTS